MAKSKIVNVDASFPPSFAPFFQPKRFKCAYGGRGGSKSWSAARALLLLGQQYSIRVLCAREFQASISESVHQLLQDQIVNLGLTDFYSVAKADITGRNGSRFYFSGIASNVTKIKSYEGVNICWLEEAENLSEYSWDIIEPTIRREGFIKGTEAEIWVTFNPRLPTDFVYRKFVLDPPENAFVTKVNYFDNPWCPQTILNSAKRMEEKDPEKYSHIYLGEPRKFLDGAVYHTELRDANRDGRITKVPYDPTLGVSCFFDLGWADATAVWFAQKAGHEIRLIDYMEDSQKPIDFYLKEINRRPYTIDTVCLPHDAKAASLGTGKSIEEIIRNKGFRTHVIPKLSLTDGINALRSVFPLMWFDAQRCEKGIEAVRNYAYEKQPEHIGGFKDTPAHNQHSHASDALRYVAIGLKSSRSKPEPKYLQNARPMMGGNTSWMSL